MDVDEVRRRKAQLAELIAEAVREFERETGALVDRVDVGRTAPFVSNDARMGRNGLVVVDIDVRL